jgi:lipoate-protein ligase A
MDKNRWYLWRDTIHDPFMNMAIDETLMLNAAALGQPILRLYSWDTDAVSIGYTQKMERVPFDNSRVVRRPTGGGIVFHKHHFTYTLVFPNDHWLVKDTVPVESYNWTNQAVQQALAQVALISQMASEDIPKSVDRAGMVCFTTPTKYDLLASERKIAGSAQRRAREGMLHQGSIELEGVVELSREKLRQFLPQGFADIFNCEFDDFSLSDDMYQQADELAASKYGSKAWNFKR